MNKNNVKDRIILIRITAATTTKTTLCKGLGMKKIPDNNLL
jgi:hypothetical protein